MFVTFVHNHFTFYNDEVVKLFKKVKILSCILYRKSFTKNNVFLSGQYLFELCQPSVYVMHRFSILEQCVQCFQSSFYQQF